MAKRKNMIVANCLQELKNEIESTNRLLEIMESTLARYAESYSNKIYRANRKKNVIATSQTRIRILGLYVPRST